LAGAAVTGCDGAGAPDGLTGVTFGYMKWCGRIYPNRRADPAIPYTGASVIFGTYARSPADQLRRFRTHVRYLRVPWTTLPEAVVATIFTV
jgi:hypothetical protein